MDLCIRPNSSERLDDNRKFDIVHSGNIVGSLTVQTFTKDTDIDSLSASWDALMFIDEIDKAAKRQESILVVSDIAVSRPYRGSRIGMAATEIMERQSGCHTSVLACMPMDDSELYKLVRYYHNFGYRIVGKTYSGHPIMLKRIRGSHD